MNIYHCTVKVFFLCITVFYTFDSLAEVSINGFGSVVAAKTNSSAGNLYGYSDELSFKPESRFSVQLTSDLSENLSATVQIIARGADNYNASFEWAYLKYSIDDNNSLKFGRIRIPFYKHSEYIDAGFAYPWLRVPQNVYNSEFNSWDGISYSNFHMLGNLEGQFQAQVGRLQDENLRTSSGSYIDIDFKGYLFEYVLTYGAWDGRVGYMGSEIEVISPLDNFVNLAVNGLQNNTGIVVPSQYVSNLLLDGDGLKFISGSIMYDNGTLFSGFEAISAKYEDMTLNPDKTASYFILGVRNQKWTYHATYGVTKSNKRNYDELLNGVTVSPSVAAVLNMGLADTFTSSGALAGEDSDFLSLGINYGFHSNAVMKIDYTSFNNSIENSAQDAKLLSVGVDFVF